MQELAEQVRGIGTGLQSRIEELGDCWGDDDTGQQFYNQYATPRDQILEGVSGTGDVLDSTADGIKTMATQYQQLEDENVFAVRQLQPGDNSGPDDPDGPGRGYEHE
jgi:uncharacterized protein YukE